MSFDDRFGLPVVSDWTLLFQRLQREEREWGRRLAHLESQIRDFEDRDRPEYERWVRREFGPQLSVLEELQEQIRQRHLLAQRVQRLIEEGYLPREALFVARHGETPHSEQDKGTASSRSTQSDSKEERDARKRAKLQAKREARRAEKKSQRRVHSQKKSTGDSSHFERPPIPDFSRKNLVQMYRQLARKLHPDSTQVISSLNTSRLWLEVQSAYEEGRLDRLISIAEWIQSESGEFFLEESSSAHDLEAKKIRIRDLERSHQKLNRQISELQQHPAWRFTGARVERGISLGNLRKKVAREVEIQCDHLQARLDSYHDFFNSIGPERKPKRIV